ncbi:hypothetical protein [Actinophytocola algeriensis]|uniref:DUF4276 family protein n=1 Tax=Actinophytocola algeriensis TaxID=1768010 RepID=A0A7W7Q4T3_9PSEU|nr:hypothetical protein [Actinophytocola algeriensis]MBB4906999.1 hypothetical protein [Actinophytocola algeriensis]MBE1478482.1 hypothetical protein [Actinophytocola algeriensis]
MTIRIVFLREGTSDSGIVPHIEAIAANHDLDVSVTDPELDRLPKPPGLAVAAKLRAVLEMGGVYDLIVVHRDADNQGVDARVDEIAAAVAVVTADVPHVPVVPVRMTEAWLLTSEDEVRRVAGNPTGRMPLGLPNLGALERIADPKELLRDALATASGVSGRRLDQVRKRFSQHRRQLLERLDRDGPVARLPSWQHFVTGVEAGLKAACDAGR